MSIKLQSIFFSVDIIQCVLGQWSGVNCHGQINSEWLFVGVQLKTSIYSFLEYSDEDKHKTEVLFILLMKKTQIRPIKFVANEMRAELLHESPKL